MLYLYLYSFNNNFLTRNDSPGQLSPAPAGDPLENINIVTVNENDVLHKSVITTLLGGARSDVTEVMDVAGNLMVFNLF